MMTGKEYLKEHIGETNIPEEHYESEIGEIMDWYADDYHQEQLILSGVGSSLPDLAECNQASLDYATKKNNPDFFLIKQTFKDGVNWALNYVTRPK